MSKHYDIRPSSIFDYLDEYTAYCLDEACSYIISRIQNGEEPDFSIDKNSSVEKQHYRSLSNMYESMGYKNGSYVK